MILIPPGQGAGPKLVLEERLNALRRALGACLETRVRRRPLPANGAGKFRRNRGDSKLREMYALTIFLDLDGTLLDHDAAERSAAIEFFTAFKTHFRRWS